MTIHPEPDEGYQLQKIELEYKKYISSDEWFSIPVYLGEDGTYIADLNKYYYPLRLRVHFCEDTPQPAAQVIPARPRYALTSSNIEQTHTVPYQVLPLNNTSPAIRWEKGPQAYDLLLDENGTFQIDPTFYNDWYRITSDFGRYFIHATNSDGSTVSASSTVAINVRSFHNYLLRAVSGEHSNVYNATGYKSPSKDIPMKQAASAWNKFAVVLDEGYEIDQVKAYEIPSGKEFTLTPVPEKDRSTEYKNSPQFVFHMPLSNLLIVVTEKPIDQPADAKLQPISCIDPEAEHLAVHWAQAYGIVGTTVEITMNYYPGQDYPYIGELMPDPGYEVDTENTVITGTTSGSRIETWVSEDDRLCFTMPDEPVTVSPAVK